MAPDVRVASLFDALFFSAACRIQHELLFSSASDQQIVCLMQIIILSLSAANDNDNMAPSTLLMATP